MNRHRRLLSKYQRRYIIRSLLFCLTACGITAILFSPIGPVNRYSGIDLSFLLLPVLGYFVIHFLSRLINYMMLTSCGYLLYIILDGIALSFGAYFFFSVIPLFTRIPLFSGIQTFLTNLSYLPWHLVTLIAGKTLLALSVPVQLTVRKTISPLFMAAGWLVIGLGLWKGLSVLEDLWSQLPGIGLVLFISSLVVAVTKLLKYGTMSSHPLLFEVVRWLSTRTMDKFLWTAIIATYFIFIRGILFRHISTAYLIEWLLFCFIAWRIFAVIKNDLEKSYIVPLNDSGWKKHVQIVDDIMDENFNELVMMQEDYVTGGSRRELMIRISRILENNGLGEEEIAVILQPIIEHSDRAIPWYAWGFIRRRIIGQNYIKRRKTLEDTIHNIAGSLVENKSGSGS